MGPAVRIEAAGQADGKARREADRGADGGDGRDDHAHHMGRAQARDEAAATQPDGAEHRHRFRAGPDRARERLTRQDGGGKDHGAGEEQQRRALDLERLLHPLDVVGQVLHRDVVTTEDASDGRLEGGDVGRPAAQAHEGVVEPGCGGPAGRGYSAHTEVGGGPPGPGQDQGVAREGHDRLGGNADHADDVQRDDRAVRCGPVEVGGRPVGAEGVVVSGREGAPCQRGAEAEAHGRPLLECHLVDDGFVVAVWVRQPAGQDLGALDRVEPSRSHRHERRGVAARNLVDGARCTREARPRFDLRDLVELAEVGVGEADLAREEHGVGPELASAHPGVGARGSAGAVDRRHGEASRHARQHAEQHQRDPPPAQLGATPEPDRSPYVIGTHIVSRRGHGEPARATSARRRGAEPVVDHSAVLHADDPLRRVGDGLVVGDEQDGLPALVKAAEQLQYLGAALAVQGARWLVGQHERGLVGEGPGDRQALALTSGQHTG
jgi:hypothetical protein